MDPESIGKETIIKVTDWLRGIWEMRHRNSPVQQWVDSIPSPTNTHLSMSSKAQVQTSENSVPMTSTEPKDIPISMEAKPPSMTVSAPINVPNSPAISITGLPSSLPYRLARDPSLQSDSSHCSSVESLLELRKADPEAILLGLGFGGCSNSPQENGSLSRIPKRFLQPSKLKGIAINDFVRHQQETSESFDSVSLGYRGLTGSPYVAPSEIVQKIMDRLREHESHEADAYSVYNCYDQISPLPQNGTLSVLSPDSRQFLERPRSKSPDMCNKRMIIGQKSFAFGHDGDLIEINPDTKQSLNNDLSNGHNFVENLETSRNFEEFNVECNEISKVVSTQKVNKILSRKLSLNTSIELCDGDTDSIKDTPNESIALKDEDSNNDINYKNIPNTSNIDTKENDDSLQKRSSDVRRASDSSYKIKFPDDIPNIEGRRHSDSTVHTIESCNSGCTSLQKRKTLKRQSRISDADAIDYCNSIFISSTPECKRSHSTLYDKVQIHKSSTNSQLRPSVSVQSISEDTKVIRENECCGAKYRENTLSQGTNSCVQMIDDNNKSWIQTNDQCCAKENELCYEEKVEQPCTHDENYVSCCCYPGTKQYWTKMDKIIQENKKLENMVAKNRREMAEIREMLNSVLSVRMEPGF